MITFFRKIRKSLIESLPAGVASKEGGSGRKYILYAIGEILLVMIGILLALQVNNWNEGRKERITEKEVLNNLAKCLETNIKQLESQLDLNHRSDKASEIILSSLENRLPYHDSLDVYIGYASNVDDSGSIFSYYGYEILKNTGLKIIRNKNLKNKIILLFEETFAIPKSRMDRVGKTYADEVAFRQEYFIRKQGYDFEPIDYDRLLNNRKVSSWFFSIRQNRAWISQSLEDALDETEKVFLLIKDELDKN